MRFQTIKIVPGLRALALLLPLVSLPDVSIAKTKPGSKAAPATAELTCEKILSVAPSATNTIELTAHSIKHIEIISNDTNDRNLKVDLGDLGLRDLTGNSLNTNALIEVEPKVSVVKGGQGLPVTIAVKDTAAVRPGVYVGSMLLSLDSDNAPKNCSKRVPIQLTVAGTRPFADKVTLRQYRPFPFPVHLPFRYVGCFWYDCAVRIQGQDKSPVLSPPREDLLGLVQNERGHTIAVYRNSPPVKKDGVVEIPLEVRGWAFAGTYEGQLNLSPSSDKDGSMQLTLAITDWFLWPILVIALSVWLGVVVKRYLNVERALWRLREQEATLGVSFHESQRKFAAAASGTSYAAYSVTEDLARSRSRLREKIDALRISTGTTLDPNDQNYKAVIDELELLRKQVAAWAGFADELKALQNALGKESDLGDPPPAYKKKLPGLFAVYGALLIGGKLTLADFNQRRDQVQQATKGARLWYALNSRIQRGEDRHANLQKIENSMSEEDKKNLVTAGDSLRVIRLALWEAEDIVSLETLSAPAGPLDTGETTLRTLAAKYGSQPPTEASLAVARALTTRGNLAMLPAVFGLDAGPDYEPADDSERARYYAAATNKWDRHLALFAFVIATLTGLQTHYLGKAFGTFEDYVELMIWGFGTKLVVDTASAAIGWLFKTRRIADG